MQGEGFWTGTPMTFIRLAGCNAAELGLGCLEWCDTQASQQMAAGRRMEIDRLLNEIHLPRLCITGGEPLLQVEGLAALLARLSAWTLAVHLETNGTIDPRPLVTEHRGRVWTTVSPKPPDYVVAEGWRGLVDELKLVADETLTTAVAEDLAASHRDALVFIQPVDRDHTGIAGGIEGERQTEGERQSSALKRAINLVISHPQWRLSLQTHKLIGMR